MSKPLYQRSQPPLTSPSSLRTSMAMNCPSLSVYGSSFQPPYWTWRFTPPRSAWLMCLSTLLCCSENCFWRYTNDHLSHSVKIALISHIELHRISVPALKLPHSWRSHQPPSRQLRKTNFESCNTFFTIFLAWTRGTYKNSTMIRLSNPYCSKKLFGER